MALCTNFSTGKKVIIKALNKSVNTRQLDSFRGEEETNILLDHQNIAKCIDSFEDEGNYHIVIEYVDGGDLNKLIKNGPVDESVGIMILQLLLALDFTQSKRIVHENIKSENILLDSKGNIKLADFGIAKILEYESNVEAIVQYSQDYEHQNFSAKENTTSSMTCSAQDLLPI